jgi:hypothetical protein
MSRHFTWVAAARTARHVLALFIWLPTVLRPTSFTTGPKTASLSVNHALACHTEASA